MSDVVMDRFEDVQRYVYKKLTLSCCNLQHSEALRVNVLPITTEMMIF